MKTTRPRCFRLSVKGQSVGKLGAFVIALNEDRFILDAIRPALEVFPDLTVVDLGSTDDTVDKARSTGASVIVNKMIHPRDFPVIKNEHSDKHEKVIWIDADEIYSVPALEELKKRTENLEPYKGIRTAYKMVMESGKNIFISNELFSAGVKGHDVSYFHFLRAAPNDCLHPRTDSVRAGGRNKLEADFNYYFWHCVLMDRSSKKEDTARAKKRAIRLEEFNRLCTWEKVDCFPWKQ